MKIYDRIHNAWRSDKTNRDYLNEADRIATEADALMVEMAEALEAYAELECIEGEGANRATEALKHYREYVK